MDTANLNNSASDLVVWIIFALAFAAAWKGSGWKFFIDSTLSKIGRIATEILEILRSYSTHKPTAEIDGPIRLNEHDTSIASEINAGAIAFLAVDKMKAATREMNTYETQQYCFQYSKDELLGELKEKHRSHYERITSCAYQNGIDASKVMHVIGIVLRDQVLEQLGKVPKPQLP